MEQRVTWFAMDKNKFQSIFEDALNEMNFGAKTSRQIPAFETSASFDDSAYIKIEALDEVCEQPFRVEKAVPIEVKCEVVVEPKMEMDDQPASPTTNPPANAMSRRPSDPFEGTTEFTNLSIAPRWIGSGQCESIISRRGDFGSMRASTPELNRKQMNNKHPLKRSHSATNLSTRWTGSTSRQHFQMEVDRSNSVEKKEEQPRGHPRGHPEEHPERVSVERKKNFISIDNILSRDDDDNSTKKSRQQSVRNDSSNLGLEFYENAHRAGFSFESFPMRCGWFGMDKKLFSGIVDTLSQMYFDNLRTEFVGLNSPKFNIANETQSLQNQVTRAIACNRHKSWEVGSIGYRKPKSIDYYFQSTHSKLFKDRFHVSRANNIGRCFFVEQERPSKRTPKPTSRASCTKGKDVKRSKEKVVNSSCVSSSTVGSPSKDGASPKKSSNSAHKKLPGKESWIRVDKSLVNGMVDFLVGQLYPEPEHSRRSEPKEEFKNSKNENSGTFMSIDVDRVEGGGDGDERMTFKDLKNFNQNPPFGKGSTGSRKNYSIGFLSKSESRGQKLVESRLCPTAAHTSGEEVVTTEDKTPQTDKLELVKKIDTSHSVSPKRDYSISISYWNQGTANNLKEAIST